MSWSVISALERLRQMDCHEFKSNLYFIENSRSVHARGRKTHKRNMKRILETLGKWKLCLKASASRLE